MIDARRVTGQMKTAFAIRVGALATATVCAILSTGCDAVDGEGTLVRRAAAAERQEAGVSGEGNPQVPDAGATLRRIWTGANFNFYASSPSPAGRYVTEIDWTTGDLAVRDLESGELHRITAKGGWSASGDYALASIFSPSGDQIAYVWWNGAAQRHEIRAIQFAVDASGTPHGSSMRVLHANPVQQPASILGWAADGSILTIMRRPGRTNALALVAADGGELSVLESFDWRVPHAALSPDGRLVAYDFPRGPDTPERDIWLISIEGRRKAAAVESPTDDVVIGWQPDGSGLLFAKRRPRGSAVYRLPIAAGQPTGSPEEISPEAPWQIEPLGMAGNTVLFGVTVESTQFHVADFSDLAAAEFARAEPIDDPYGGSIRAWDWSPDGVYFVHDARGQPGQSDFRVVIRSLDGGAIRNFRLDGRAEFLRWAPDGRSIYVQSWDAADRPGLRVLDLESGTLRTIRQFEFEWQPMGGHFDLSPDGRYLCYRILESGAPVRIPTRGGIRRLDLETGEERTLQAARSGGSLAFSPDGSRLAFVDYDADAERYVVRSVPAAGGEPSELFRQAEGHTIGSLSWTIDGQTIVLLDGAPGGGRTLLGVPAAGGDAEILAAIPALADAEPRVHPDGRRIAYRAGRSRGEIWALDGISQVSNAER
jgi:Tol biopolymer transport system component